MNEDYFWEIIEKSNSAAEESEYPEGLVRELKKLKPTQIIEFYKIYVHLHEQADLGDVWAACEILETGYCTDDGFEYFRNWLISQGRSVYEQALVNPDSLASLTYDVDEKGRPYVGWESFGYAADYAYEDLTKKRIYDDVEESHMFSSIQKAISLQQDDWDWQDYTNEVLAKKLPKLWQKYGKFKIESDNAPPKTQYELYGARINGLGVVSVGDILLHKDFGVGTVKSMIVDINDVVTTTLMFSGEERHMIIDGHSGLWSFKKQTMK